MQTPSAQEIEAVLTREIASILSRSPGDIQPDASLHSLGMDSMSFVEILVFIEKTFNLRLIETGLTREDFQTVRALAACIAQECSPP